MASLLRERDRCGADRDDDDDDDEAVVTCAMVRLGMQNGHARLIGGSKTSRKLVDFGFLLVLCFFFFFFLGVFVFRPPFYSSSFLFVPVFSIFLFFFFFFFFGKYRIGGWSAVLQARSLCASNGYRQQTPR